VAKLVPGGHSNKCPNFAKPFTLHAILNRHTMIAKTLLSIITVLNLLTAFGQERILTKQTKLSEAILLEKEINDKPKFLNQNISLSKDYYPLFDKYKVVNPLVIQREPVGYLPVYAQYFYTPEDSIIRLISYDWEKDEFGNFFDKQKIWEQESKKFTEYNSEYERIKAILVKQLGTPSTTDSKAKTETSDRGKYFTRETVWENEDMHAELSMIFESMTYRVRLTLYWKK
jgi:hypothetical protein